MKKFIFIAFLFLFGSILMGTASAATLDFNSIATGNYSETDFSNLFLGVDFDNTGGDNFNVYDVTLGADFSGRAILNSPYNTLGNSTIATFDSSAGLVSVTLGDYASDSDNLYLFAYDASNNLVGSDFFANPSSSSAGHTLTVTAADIAWVEFYGVGLNNNSVYWDNFTFENDNAQAPVPEPATILLLGFGLLGAFAFRRKK